MAVENRRGWASIAAVLISHGALDPSLQALSLGDFRGVLWMQVQRDSLGVGAAVIITRPGSGSVMETRRESEPQEWCMNRGQSSDVRKGSKNHPPIPHKLG